MGASGSSLTRIGSFRRPQNSSKKHTDGFTKILLLIECSTDLDFKYATGLLKSSNPLFRIHVTMPEFNDMEKVVNMTVIEHLNKDLFFHAMDVTDDKAVEVTVDSVSKSEGRIDILVCSLDARTMSKFESTSLDDYVNSFSRNVFSHIRVIQQVLPVMKRQNRADIIVLSNVAGIQGIPYHTLYCAAKFAVEGFFESIAAECAAHNIRVTILEMALQEECEVATLDLMIDSHLLSGSSKEEDDKKSAIENQLKKNELKKKTKPERVIEAIQEIALSLEHNSLRQYLNRSALNLAKSRFADTKGMKQLNEVMKFFLNLDLENNNSPTMPSKRFLKRTKSI